MSVQKFGMAMMNIKAKSRKSVILAFFEFAQKMRQICIVQKISWKHSGGILGHAYAQKISEFLDRKKVPFSFFFIFGMATDRVRGAPGASPQYACVI